MEHTLFNRDEKRRRSYMAQLYKRNIRTIVRIAKDNNVKVLLCTQLVDKNAYTPENMMVDEKLKEVAREEGVPILNFDDFNIADPKKEGMLQTYVHLTPKGCEFVSDKMVEALLKNDLLSKR